MGKTLSSLLSLLFGMSLLASCGLARGGGSGDTRDQELFFAQEAPNMPQQLKAIENTSVRTLERIPFEMDFTARTLEKRQDPNDDVVVSPFSAGVAVSMLMEGARGRTREEIRNALGGASFKGVELYADSANVVCSANSVWTRKGIDINDSYTSLLRNDYGALAASRDFSSHSTVDEINSWCSENTGGKIPSIMGQIPSDAALILLNALYFNGSWASPFSPSATEEDVFHGSLGPARVPFMNKTQKFYYADLGFASAISLPYKNRQYSMLIILPSPSTDVSDIVKEMDYEGFSALTSAMNMKKVILSLPRFKVDNDFSINDILKSLGIKEAFLPSADLSGISPLQLAVSSAAQRCLVEVDEKGTVAAAVTRITVGLTAVREQEHPVVMKVDRPFLFAIVKNDNTDILFAGRIMNIKQ